MYAFDSRPPPVDCLQHMATSGSASEELPSCCHSSCIVLRSQKHASSDYSTSLPMLLIFTLSPLLLSQWVCSGYHMVLLICISLTNDVENLFVVFEIGSR